MTESSETTAAESTEAAETEGTEATVTTGGATAVESAAPASTAATSSGDDSSALDAEGDIAADYLEELLDIADIDGDIDIDIEHGRAAVEIVSEEDGGRGLRRLVGDEGEVLDALQELTRLAVQARTGDRSRLMLDVAGHRQARRDALTELANTSIAQVQTTGQDVSLSAMNPFERKVVHDAVAAAGLVSDSEGVEPNRRVVIRAGS